MTDVPPEFSTITRTPEETRALGATLGQQIHKGGVVALIGPLGAGKTQFVKGLAKGLEVPDERPVTSPTFTLIHEYPGRLTLVHVDAYRLPDAAALNRLGWDEFLRPDAVVVVEWADRVTEILPADRIEVRIDPHGPTERVLSFAAGGETARRELQTLQTAWAAMDRPSD